MDNRDYIFFNVRDAAELTTSYVAGTVLAPTAESGEEAANPSVYNQLIVYVDFTIGSLDTAEIKIEFSHDGSTYYQETFSSISSGTDSMSAGEHQFDATGKYRIEIPIKDNYIKISAKGTGTVTDSSMKIDAVLGNT